MRKVKTNLMRKTATSRTLLALAFLGMVVGPGSRPVAGDWLVTYHGDRIETVGPWEVKGRLLVFTRPGGHLSSLRLSQVDLDASSALTRQAQEPAPSEEPPRVEKRVAPVLVLTDKDVGHVSPAQVAPLPSASLAASSPPSGPTASPQGTNSFSGSAVGRADSPAVSEVRTAQLAEPAETAVPEPPPRRLEVLESREISDPESLVIVGRVRNSSKDVAAEIQLAVSLYDEEGDVIASKSADLSTRVLRPGQRTNFRATFPNVLYARMDFDAQSVAFKRSSGAPPNIRGGQNGR